MFQSPPENDDSNNSKDIIDVTSTFPIETIDETNDIYIPSVKVSFQKYLLNKIKTLPITYWILIVNSVFFLFQHLYFAENIFDFDIETSSQSIWRFGSLNFLLVYFNNEWYRLLSCVYLHNWWFHFLLNMLNLYLIGVFIENIFGKNKYFIIYTITGIVASLSSYYVNFSYVDSLGASGSIFGLVGALTTFIIRNKSFLNPEVSKKLFMSLVFVIILNLGIGFGWNIFISSNVRVDNAGHVGGLVSGLLLGYFFPAYIITKTKDSLLFRIIGILLFIITIACFVWSFKVFYDTELVHNVVDYLTFP